MIDTINVIANPHHAHDHKGEPAAAVQFIDENGALHLYRWVGAFQNHARSGAHALDLEGRNIGAVKGKITVVDGVEVVGEGRVIFDFSTDAQRIPFEGPAKQYYINHVLAGSLVPADAESMAKLNANGCALKSFGLPKCEHDRCKPFVAPKPAPAPSATPMTTKPAA